MVHALGYSSNDFDTHRPGRLCRGRERWIEPWPDEPPEGGEPAEGIRLHRVVVSGAEFTDDSAADARRGLPFSTVDMASIIGALFPRRTLLAFMEDGHPADIPADAHGIEAYEGYRAGGRQPVGLVRWHKRITGVPAIRELLGPGAPDERVRGFAVVDDETNDDALADRLFALSGFSTLDSPPARYQPAALPDVLELTPAVVLIHRDKHGPALGIYAREQLPKLDERLGRLCESRSALLVPFAIPPMLARWDRALAELRSVWMDTHEQEFPVPPSPEPPRDRRRDRRRRDRKKAEARASEE